MAKRRKGNEDEYARAVAWVMERFSSCEHYDPESAFYAAMAFSEQNFPDALVNHHTFQALLRESILAEMKQYCDERVVHLYEQSSRWRELKSERENVENSIREENKLLTELRDKLDALMSARNEIKDLKDPRARGKLGAIEREIKKFESRLRYREKKIDELKRRLRELDGEISYVEDAIEQHWISWGVVE